MKKLLITVLILLFGNIIKSQSLYFGASYQQNIGIRGDYAKVSNTTYNYDNNTDSISYTSEISIFKLSLGSGKHPNLFVGYSLNDWLSVELLFGYHIGKNQTLEESAIFNEDGIQSRMFSDYSFSSKAYNFIPSFSLNKKYKNYNFFLKAGLIYSISEIKDNINISFIEGSPFYYPFTSLSQSGVYTGSKNIGHSISIGVDYVFNNSLMFFLNIGYNNLFWFPEKHEITNYIFNGEEMVDLLTNYDRYIEYSTSYTESSKINEELPEMQTPIYFSSKSVGIEFGFKYSINMAN